MQRVRIKAFKIGYEYLVFLCLYLCVCHDGPSVHFLRSCQFTRDAPLFKNEVALRRC